MKASSARGTWNVIATGGDKLTDKKHFTAFGNMNHRGDMMAANMHSATMPAAALIQTDQERERVDPDQRGRQRHPMYPSGRRTIL